jgi:hypothetical protein
MSRWIAVVLAGALLGIGFVAGLLTARATQGTGEPSDLDEIKDVVVNHVVEDHLRAPAFKLADLSKRYEFVFETLDRRKDRKVIAVGFFHAWAEKSVTEDVRGRFWIEVNYDSSSRSWKPKTISISTVKWPESVRSYP